MLKSSSTWESRCAQRANAECIRLSRELPSSLARLALEIGKSNKSWEWKHFWVENARLWERQSLRTKTLRGDWSTTHDEVFEDWNKSEHAEIFLKALNLGAPLPVASKRALKVLEDQLKQIAIRHFNVKGKWDPSYSPQFELGEFPVSAQSKSIQLDHLKSLEFFTWDNVHLDNHLSRIEQALSLIKTYSPESFDIFKSFTKRIVPIKQREFVSYSLQSLPGHSFINLYHRDDLDLLDDLLHENGHHHLNHYLILESPLREDPDQIYYSPWRRSLRPVRGIYHAHLTFFFALKLYHDLAKALLAGELHWPHPLSLREKEKILRRFKEEWMMLEFTAVDLRRAIERGQILPPGIRLLEQMEVERRKLGEISNIVWKALSHRSKMNLEKLSLTLKKQAQLTRDL